MCVISTTGGRDEEGGCGIWLTHTAHPLLAQTSPDVALYALTYFLAAGRTVQELYFISA